MKKTFFLFLTAALCTACYNEDLRPSFRYASQYLSDNYAQGDTICFVNKNPTVDTFIVSSSGGSLTYENYREFHNFDTADYGSCGVKFQSITENFTVVINILLRYQDRWLVSCFERYGTDDKQVEGFHMESVDAPQKDVLFTLDYLVLEKGKGVLSFSTTDDHTWTRKE